MGINEGDTSSETTKNWIALGTEPVENYADWFAKGQQYETPVPIKFKLNLMTDLMKERCLSANPEFGIDESHKFDAPAMVAAFKQHMKNYCKLILGLPNGCPQGNIKGIGYRDLLYRTYKYKLARSGFNSVDYI